MDTLTKKTAAPVPNSSTFLNWSDEDFSCMWDGVDYTIEAGHSVKIEMGDSAYNAHVASHFAKHLTDREMDKAGLNTNEASRVQYVARCFGEKVGTPEKEEAVDDTPEATIEEEAPAPKKPAAKKK